MTDRYEMSLQVPAWTDASDVRRPTDYRPTLFLVRRDQVDLLGILAEVAVWVDDRPDKDRWMAQLYPLEAENLGFNHDEGESWRIRRYPRRALEPSLGYGELRFPRANATQAIDLMFEKLADEIPVADLAALRKVAGLLRPQLEQMTRAYLTRFRPSR